MRNQTKLNKDRVIKYKVSKLFQFHFGIPGPVIQIINSEGNKVYIDIESYQANETKYFK